MTIHFVLPGYAPRPVGGYRVAYEYAVWMHHHLDERVVVHHPALSEALYTRPITPEVLRWMAYRAYRQSKDRPGREGVSWFPRLSEVDCRFAGSLGRTIQSGDILVATAVQTALYAARYIRHHPSVNGVNFIQHVEQWALPGSLLESSWRLPLRRIVIAPWLREYGEALGVESVLVPNAIDASDFAAGDPLSLRPESVVAMVSEVPFKRLDVLTAAFEHLKRLRPDVTIRTFGTGSRPESLPPYVEYLQSPDRARLSAMYRGSRVYMCGSDAEGWHLPPAEAMLSGCAVVSTDIGGVRAYAEQAALFSPPGDAVSLARNAARLLGNTAEAQELADRGQSRLSGYTPDQAAESFAREVLASREPPRA